MQETKKLWLRMGISLWLTANEFKAVSQGGDKGKEIIVTKMRAGQFVLDGESYSPAQNSCAIDEWQPDKNLEFDLFADMGAKEFTKTQIKVIIENGCVSTVLKNQDNPIHVEVIDIDSGYSDYAALAAYGEEVQAEPKFVSCDYSVADFKGKKPNTRISYLYRDSGNYKVHNECVIAGELSKEQILTILDCLDEGENFIPSLVGLPEVKFDEYDDPELDHPWFELEEDGFQSTFMDPSVSITAEELVEAFERCKNAWNQI